MNMSWKSKAKNTADVRLITRWMDLNHLMLRTTQKQKLMLVMQKLQLEACLLHHPMCYGAAVGDDDHDGVLNGDGRLFLVYDDDDGVVQEMLQTKIDDHY